MVKINHLLVILVLTLPAVGYEFIAGYVYWYPHIPFDLSSSTIEGSVNLRTVWNISSFPVKPTKESCSTLEFSKGTLECEYSEENKGCIPEFTTVPPVKFRCTDVNAEYGWVAGQMVFNMNIAANETVKLSFSGIDWPPTETTFENQKISNPNDKLEFVYNSKEGIFPPIGLFPYPIVTFNLSCYGDAVTAIPLFDEQVFSDFQRVYVNETFFINPVTSKVDAVLVWNQLSLVQQVWDDTNGGWRNFEKYENFHFAHPSSMLQFRFQNETGLFPISLVASKTEGSGESQVPIMFLLEVVGTLEYSLEEQAYNGGGYRLRFTKCSSCATSYTDGAPFLQNTICVKESPRLEEFSIAGPCVGEFEMPADGIEEEPQPKPLLHESTLTSIKPTFLIFHQNGDGLAHVTELGMFMDTSPPMYETRQKLNGSFSTSSKIPDFVHLESADASSSEPKRYSVTKLQPECTTCVPLKIVNVSPNGTCPPPCKDPTLHIQFNQEVEKMYSYRIGYLYQIVTNEKGLEETSKHKYIGQRESKIINGNTLQVKPEGISFDSADEVGSSWYFNIDAGLVKSKNPFICDQKAAESPGISDNSTWRITVADPYPPSADCADLYYVNSTVKIPISISEPLKSYSCHLSKFDPPSQPQQHPCQLENQNHTLALTPLSEKFKNRSLTVLLVMEDLHGNAANYTKCSSFYVDMKPPTVHFDASQMTTLLGLDDSDTSMKIGCSDDSEKSQIHERFGGGTCILYYKILRQGSNNQQEWTKVPNIVVWSGETRLSQLYKHLDSNTNEAPINESGQYQLQIKAKDNVENWSPVVEYTVSVDADNPKISGVENKTLDCNIKNATSIEVTGKALATDKTSNITKIWHTNKIENISLLNRTWRALDSAGNLVEIKQYLWFPNDSLDVSILSSAIHIPCHKAYSLMGTFSTYKNQISFTKNRNTEVMVKVTDKCKARDFYIQHTDLSHVTWKCGQQRHTVLEISLYTNSEHYRTINQTIVIGPMTALSPLNGATDVDPRKPISFQWSIHPENLKSAEVFVWQADQTKPMNPAFRINRPHSTRINSYSYKNESLLHYSRKYNWQVTTVFRDNSEDIGPLWSFSTMAEMCVGSCSGNGVCVGKNQCQCFPKFTGEKCSQCSSGYWGSNCDKCPACVNGQCNQRTGSCTCSDNKWTGDLCNECSTGRIGPNCEKLPFMTEIYPDSGADTGGTLVHIKGYNFDHSADYKCKFGSAEVSTKVVSTNLIECTTPQHTAELVIVSVEGMQSKTEGEFLYVAECGSNDCGAGNTPKKGYCAFGRCICEKLWLGANCEIPVIKPRFTMQHQDDVKEFGQVTVTLNIVEGTQPVTWPKSRIPKDANFNMTSGIIKIKKTRDAQFLIFNIVASNRAGDTSKQLNLTVQPAYKVKNVKIDGKYILPAPNVVTVSGEIEISQGHQVPDVPAVPVIVRVSDSKGKIRKLRALVKVGLNERKFSATYIPSQMDVGKYIVDAVHPFYENNPTQEMASWTVLGLTTTPKNIYVHRFIDELSKGHKICSVTNAGSEKVTDVKYELLSQPPTGVTMRLTTNESLSQNQLAKLLNPGSSFHLYLFVDSAQPVQGDVVFQLTTSEGSKNYITIHLRTKAKSSILQLNPSHMNVAVLRGSPQMIPIQVTNVGSLPAVNLSAEVPKNAGISVTAIGQTKLEAGKSTSVTFRCFYAKDEELGTRTGNIIIRSNDHWVRLPYSIIITSDNKLDIKVLVEDEYTYFKPEKPPLAGAKVEVWGVNRATSFSGKQETGTDGIAIFPNVNESFYNLLVYAENHESWRGVVHFSPAASNKTIFLRKEKVKVKFVVKYTPITDEYVIELESTFETSVPLPVVTMKPQTIDLQALEEGRMDQVDFEVTNHGLIQVTNVRMDFSAEHPFLQFVVDDQIPFLPANTTYTLTMLVKPKKRAKRSSGSSCFIPYSTSYEYTCNGPQTDTVRGAISKPCPSMPGSSWSAPVYSGWTSSGGGARNRLAASGYAGSYESSTPLSCKGWQCAKAVGGCFIKDKRKCVPYNVWPNPEEVLYCVHPYFMVLGCVKGVAESCIEFIVEVIYVYIDEGLGEHFRRAFHRSKRELDKMGEKRKKRETPESELATKEMALSLAGVEILQISQETIFGKTEPIDNVKFVQDATGIKVDDLNDNYKFILTMMEVEFKRFEADRWKTLFLQAVADSSDVGNFISSGEQANLIKAAEANENKERMLRFLNKWNDSMEAWKTGKNTSESSTEVWKPSHITDLRQAVKSALKHANQLGHSSISEWAGAEHYKYLKFLEQEDSDQGVCATVRVKISQRAVLTRDAFTARLELENGQTNTLEKVLVKIRIWKAKDIFKESQLEHFAVGSPVLSGITSVAGDGELPADTSASAEWLIIPRLTAVSEGEETFYVGGSIEYTQNGLKSQTVLSPGQIIVKAQPVLQLHYFHQKYIYGDDPFTKNVVEEPIPFVLAVMVINKGNGTARNLKITSAQPEIIENEKGLLIDFEIIGSQVGLSEAERSLTVNFGDVPPRSVKVAQWLLTSSLNGQFSNLSASFVNINPLGDETLSLVESVAYHELTHVIEKLAGTNTNFYGDFLVNDEVDSLSYPETIFETLTGSAVMVTGLDGGTATVSSVKITIKFDKPKKFSGMKWHYGQAIIQKSLAPPRNYVPISFTDENGESKPLRNAWITRSVTKKNPWISIVDLVVESQRPNCCSYVVQFGTADMVPTTTTTTPAVYTTTLPSLSSMSSVSHRSPSTTTITTASSPPTSVITSTKSSASPETQTTTSTIQPATSAPGAVVKTTTTSQIPISSTTDYHISLTSSASSSASSVPSTVTSATTGSTIGTSPVTPSPATSMSMSSSTTGTQRPLTGPISTTRQLTNGTEMSITTTYSVTHSEATSTSMSSSTTGTHGPLTVPTSLTEQISNVTGTFLSSSTDSLGTVMTRTTTQPITSRSTAGVTTTTSSSFLYFTLLTLLYFTLHYFTYNYTTTSSSSSLSAGLTTSSSTASSTSSAPLTLTVTTQSATVGNENTVTLKVNWGTHSPRTIDTITIWAHRNFRYLANGNRNNYQRRVTLFSPTLTNEATVPIKIRILNARVGEYKFTVAIRIPQMSAIRIDFTVKQMPAIRVDNLGLKVVRRRSRTCVNLGRTRVKVFAEIAIKEIRMFRRRKISPRERITIEESSNNNVVGDSKLSNLYYTFSLSIGEVLSSGSDLPYILKFNATHQSGVAVSATSNGTFIICGQQTRRKNAKGFWSNIHERVDEFWKWFEQMFDD